MERSKVFLILIIVGLGILTGLILTDGNKTSVDYDPTMFRLEQPELSDQIVMTQSDREVVLDHQGEWRVDDKFVLDKSLQQVLFSMMQQWQIKRPVAKASNQAVIEDLTSNGTKVTVITNGQTELEFYAGGIASQKISYFYRPGDKRAYIIEIPGYTNYITAILNLTDLQWKDRKLFSSPWQSIQRLEINYDVANKENLSFSGDNSFPSIEEMDMSAIDTARMMNYLQQYAYFETNEHVDITRFDQFDSLSRTIPIGKITLSDLDASMSNSLTIWPRLPQDRVHLTVDNNGNWSVIEQRRVQALLPSKKDFLKVEKPF
ncbi:MAG: hypothetical protein RIF33_18475 [Cyclobacteriaceae bacterium]